MLFCVFLVVLKISQSWFYLLENCCRFKWNARRTTCISLPAFPHHFGCRCMKVRPASKARLTFLCRNSSPDPGFLLSAFARCFSLQIAAAVVVSCISEEGKQCKPSGDIRPLLREKSPFCFVKKSGGSPISVHSKEQSVTAYCHIDLLSLDCYKPKQPVTVRTAAAHSTAVCRDSLGRRILWIIFQLPLVRFISCLSLKTML